MLISNKNFLISEADIPKIPVEFSEDALSFWREQKKRCINGYWSSGKYMPGPLYFYVNFWHIKHKKDNQEMSIRPTLRDIEWEWFRYWLEARGFSRFSNQTKEMVVGMTPRDILERVWGTDQGYPLFENSAKNLMVIAARGTGKSFIASCIIGHEWLFDGLKYYENADSLNGKSTEIVVGAGEAFYSTTLLGKVRNGLNELKGGMMFNNKWYPSPLSKQWSGSWFIGKEIKSEYTKKMGGTWKTLGSGSTIKHRTFKDNPYAANGTRPNVLIFEEAGLFPGLESAHNASKEMMRIAGKKFGTELVIGTGGDMDRGTVDAYKLFYSPEVNDCLAFEDTWEGKGSIGYFIPAYRYMEDFMNEEGVCDEIKARERLEADREYIKKYAKTSSSYDDELQNRPLKPSEAFLQTKSNIFPVAEIQDWLGILETKKIYQDAEFICDLIFDENGDVVPRLNTSLSPIRKFPLSPKDDATGAITIFHHPETEEDGNILYGRYVAGIDPYDTDEAQNSRSLGSMIVIDRFTNTVVCEYSGRPKFASMFWENCRKICIYYNAACLYENEKPGIKQHFESKGSLNYLMRQPKYIKEVIPNSSVERNYGMHMPEGLKSHGELLLRDWLQDESEVGRLNVRNIRSVTVLKELLFYDDVGNFDRVIAMILCMYAMKELRKTKEEYVQEKTKTEDGFFKRKLFQRGAIAHR